MKEKLLNEIEFYSKLMKTAADESSKRTYHEIIVRCWIELSNLK